MKHNIFAISIYRGFNLLSGIETNIIRPSIEFNAKFQVHTNVVISGFTYPISSINEKSFDVCPNSLSFEIL